MIRMETGICFVRVRRVVEDCIVSVIHIIDTRGVTRDLER